MILLIFFAFLAGIVTILSPCILPILPIVLSGSLSGGKRRPLGVVTGFILSFTFFTLFLSAIVRATGISADALRTLAVVVIAFFGLSLIIPIVRLWMEKIFSRLAGLSPKQSQQDGFISGILVGLTLGLIWAPCVGPILASIISLALTGTITGSAVVITLAYSVGTAIPLLAITYGGRNLLNRVPWLTKNTLAIQKTFGVLMILTALTIYFNLDRKFQTYILETFPNYGVGLTKFEDNPFVKKQLDALRKKPMDESQRGRPMYEVVEPDLGLAPDFIGGQKWFNSEPLTLNQLRGKVVLVDFWTYTCINCIRTLPYLRSWWEKYNEKGLVIVGVHTPEFEFEKSADNVAKAIADFKLAYPIVQDNNYAIWNAYDNRYWPAKYLIDKNGKIRYTHFGEGEYDETEKKIVELLNETGMGIDKSTIQNPAYQVRARTPETYLGYQRMRGLSSPEQIQPDKPTTYSTPASTPYNTFAFSGTWTVGAERSMPELGSILTFHFDAAEVFLVMRPNEQNAVGAIKIYLDDVPISKDFQGEDVTESVIKVTSDRLYKLIRLPTPGPHILKIEILDTDIELYAFTFG